MTYFHMGNPTLSSALSRFTAEFGMDQVGPTRYCRQTNWFHVSLNTLLNSFIELQAYTYLKHKPFTGYMVKSHGQLVLVSFIHY